MQTSPGPGWYRDPSGRFALRWWTGERWSRDVSDGRATFLDAVPSDRPAEGVGVEERPGGVVFPLRALWLALGGVAGGIVIAGVLAAPVMVVAPERRAIAAALSMLGLYAGFGGACWIASVQWGTRRPLADLGVRFEGADALWGGLAAFSALVVAVVLGLLASKFPDIQGNNTDFIREQGATPIGAAFVVAATVVGAPIFEELFFRGLVLRSLLSRFATVPAIAVQAGLFGLLHTQFGQGLGTISVIIVTSLLGAVFGVAATSTGRLAPGMIGHALFNGVVVVPLVLSL